MLFSAHIRAARALLGISQDELAKISYVSSFTIKKMEISQENLDNANQKTVKKIKNALEKKGIRFLQSKENEGINGIGVRYFRIDE
jgi:predicted transcriptional regulator